MSVLRVEKVVSALPGTLEPDTIYAVRVGDGFDLHISDTTGAAAHQINYPPETGRMVVTQAAHGFSARDLVVLSGGTWVKAVSTTRPHARYLGGMVESVTTDTFVVVFHGIVSGFSSLTAGANYYLGSSAGILSSLVSERNIGVAVSATELYVSMGVPLHDTVVTTSVYSGGVQTLTTTPATVSGSSLLYFPMYKNSKITYRYDLTLGREDVDGIVHFRCLVDGVDQTAYRIGTGLSVGDGRISVSFNYVNTSETGKTFSLQASEFSGAYNVKLHETAIWEGAGASHSSAAVLTVTEVPS